MKKRVGIYFFFDQDGIVRDFVIKYIEGLKVVCNEVWIIVNGKLTADSEKKLKKIESNVVLRENEGFDVWAYKSMIEKLGWDYIYKYDELVLCNFTCYGPIYPFEEMFTEMESRKCDFWGLIKHPEQPSYLLPDKKGYIYEHLMSYFIVVKRKMLISNDFRTYWDNIPDIKTKRESTAYHETVFTKYFEDLGYISDSYIKLDKYKDRCYNSSIIMAYELLVNDRCPLVKRRAFFFPEYEALLNIGQADKNAKLIDFIDNNTEYDVNLIWQDLFETQKMSVLHNNMHLNYVISSKETNVVYDNRTSYFIFIPKSFYLEILENVIDLKLYSNNIFILFNDRNIENYIDEICEKYGINSKYVEVRSNRVAMSCLLSIKDEIEKKEYSCCIFEYGEVEQKLSISEEDIVRYIYCSLINNTTYQQGIISKFVENDKMGILVPCETDFSIYYSQPISKFNNNLEKNKETYDELKLCIPFDDEKFYNNEVAFWGRKNVLINLIKYIENKKNYEEIFKRNNFNFMLPMLIQSFNYYVGTVISDEQAGININQNHFMKHLIVKEQSKKSGNDFWRFWDMYSYMRQTPKIETKIENKYIYINPNREEIVNTHFSFKEIISIICKYPKHRREYKNIKKKNLKNSFEDKPVFTYLRNVSLENNRIVLYFMCGKNILDEGYVILKNKKYFSKKRLNSGQIELVKYVKDYSNAYAYFFELPVDKISNDCIKLYNKNGEQIYFKWAAGISYNAIELSDIGLYSRITCEGYWVQTKKEYKKSILKSKEYSIKDKLLFLFMYYNQIHKNTIMSENLSAADNTFQLYKYCVDNKCCNNIYYLVSKKVYDSVLNKKYKKNMIIQNTKKHERVMKYSKRWIGSFSLRMELFPTTDKYKDIHYSLLPANWIFIPHGMAVGDKVVQMLYKYAWDNPRETYTNSLEECKAYENIYGFKNVNYLGSPRMDKWTGVKMNKNEVFIFFTWRLGLSKGRVSYYNSFEESDYFKTIVNIINNIINKFPKYKVNYAFHHEIVKMGYDELIKNAFKNYDINYIYLNDMNGVEQFNKHFASSKYLITDFSSVAYDFSIKDNAIPIYYLEENFIKYHYTLNDKFYDIHVGCVVRSLSELNRALELDSTTHDMELRRKRFFGEISDNNTKKVYESIFENDNIKKNTIIEKKYNRKLAIYFFYDEEGIVDEYVFFYLKELSKICEEICVVINGKIEKQYLCRLQNIVNKVLVRDNVGFDSAAYKYAIESYGYENIADNYDELILNNFTNYGPIFPFQNMFDYMENVECDFWGHNRYHAHSGQKLADVPMVDHLQSYFTVFRNSILKTVDFKRYWNTLEFAHNYTEAVKNHEIRYTKYFEELGYISGEYIPYDAYDDNSYNSIMYMAFSQIEKYKSPFLKRKVFFTNEGKFLFPLREEQTVYDLLKYIKSNTKYDINLIKNNILRTQGHMVALSEKEKKDILDEYNTKIKDAIDVVDKRKAYQLKNQIVSNELINEFFDTNK